MGECEVLHLTVRCLGGSNIDEVATYEEWYRYGGEGPTHSAQCKYSNKVILMLTVVVVIQC
jgi:hypothetical protein